MKLKRILVIVACGASIALIFGGCSHSGTLSTTIVPPGGGTISPSDGTFQGRVTIVATANKYYRFVRWAGDASGNSNPLTISMNSPKHVVAQFAKLTYTVQLQSNPPSGGTVRPDSGEFEAGSQITVSATPANGYRFDHWSGDASGTANPLLITPDRDMVITANFIKQWPLNTTADPTQGTVNPSGGIYDEGKVITVTATALFPYAFQTWTGADNNNSNPTTVTMNGDKNVSASFVKLVPKTPSPLQNNGNTHGTATIPIDLNKSEWVGGSIDCDAALPAQDVSVQGPDGQTIKDFGRPGHANIQFQAPTSGRYTVVIQANGISTWGTNYNLSYTVYGLP